MKKPRGYRQDSQRSQSAAAVGVSAGSTETPMQRETKDKDALLGRVAIVTGSSRGLGRAIAIALAGAGASVVLAARNQKQLEETANLVSGDYLIARTDVTRRADVEALVEKTLAKFGRIDILVNNAGISVPKPLLETTDSEWDAVIDTDLKALFYCTRAVGRHFIEVGRGKVINISSVFAVKGIPRYISYCTCKAGMVGFTQALAVEWARYGIQVNAVAPGYFTTDQTADLRDEPERYARILQHIPARRMAEPFELGPLIVFLASDGASYISGETVVIDGAYRVR